MKKSLAYGQACKIRDRKLALQKPYSITLRIDNTIIVFRTVMADNKADALAKARHLAEAALNIQVKRTPHLR